MAEDAALLAHHHRLQAAGAALLRRRRRLLLRLHLRPRMVDHHAVLADDRVVVQLVLDADVAVDDARRRHALTSRHRLRPGIGALHHEVLVDDGRMVVDVDGRRTVTRSDGHQVRARRVDELLLGGRGARASGNVGGVGEARRPLHQDVLRRLAELWMGLNHLLDQRILTG